MGYSISICIPVYNCAEYLGQALNSILHQTDKQVEVIVYDGGSTDGTRALMENYVSAWPNLQFHRGNDRGGIDADMATCASFAQGEYIWLFSGDDVMRPGAIQRALVWIENGEDVYLCEHTICNLEMLILRSYPMLAPNKPTCIDLSDPILRLEWFRRALTTEPFFSFMSSIMVRREKWQSGRFIENFDGSCWGHVARLFELMPSGLRVCYVAEIWLDQRGGNDSFSDKGVVNRTRIGIEGYHKLADVYFGHDSKEAFHIRRVIRNEFTLRSFLRNKCHCQESPQRESRKLLDELFFKAYCDTSLTSMLCKIFYRILPIQFIKLIRKVYQWGKGILKKDKR